MGGWRSNIQLLQVSLVTALDLLELLSRMWVVTHPTWVLGTQSNPLQEQYEPLTPGPPVQPNWIKNPILKSQYYTVSPTRVILKSQYYTVSPTRVTLLHGWATVQLPEKAPEESPSLRTVNHSKSWNTRRSRPRLSSWGSAFNGHGPAGSQAWHLLCRSP